MTKPRNVCSRRYARAERELKPPCVVRQALPVRTGCHQVLKQEDASGWLPSDRGSVDCSSRGARHTERRRPCSLGLEGGRTAVPTRPCDTRRGRRKPHATELCQPQPLGH